MAQQKSLFSHICYISRFAFPYKYAIGAGLITLVATDLGNLFVPWLLGLGIDSLKGSSTSHNQLFYFSLLIIFIAFIRAAVRFGWRWYLMGAAQAVERDMRLHFFNHVIRLPIPFYARNRIGELLALSSNDLVAIRRAVGEGVLTSADFLISFAGVLFFMINISPELTLYAAIPMPIITALFIYFGPQIHARFHAVQTSFGNLTTDTEESISGLRVIRAYAQESGEKERFSNANEDYLKKNIKLIRVDATFHTLMFLIPSLVFPFILLLGGLKIINGQISVGDFIAFNMYIGQLVWPMMAIGWTFNIFQRAGASTDRIRTFFDEPHDFESNATHELASLSNQPIIIKNLTFRYPNAQSNTLENFSCTIAPHQTVAIMGRTGAGKTTFFNLLLRLYDPPRGTIFIGKIDILDIPKTTLRKYFSVAPQTPFLFTDTLHNNIIFSCNNEVSEISDSHRVAHAAQLHDDISLMPDQYLTVVGERGTTLSGGQRQRTAIARAFLAKRPILLLDDPLSAVDTVTESRILNYIQSEKKNQSLIMITHRICAAEIADKIIVLEHGKVKFEGAPTDAYLQCEFYKEIANHQSIK